MRGKREVFRKDANGCIVPTIHKLNQDGYLRMRDPDYMGTGRAPLIMWHKYVGLKAGREIPEGYSIHHKCHCRCCCNLEHLELVSTPEHAKHHNATRYKARKELAKAFYDAHNMTGTELAGIVNVTIPTACRWIREWKRRD